MTEHGTPSERRSNAKITEHGATERGTPAEQPEHNGTTMEYRNNGTPQKLKPEGKHVIFLSGGIRVRIPQELSVVAFWSWNLDAVVFQSWNLDVVAFCPLKKCLEISMPWFFGLGISMSWVFGLGISMSWYMCLHGLVFVFIMKIEQITQNYFNYIVEEYFNYPNLCNSYLHNVCITRLEQ